MTVLIASASIPAAGLPCRLDGVPARLLGVFDEFAWVVTEHDPASPQTVRFDEVRDLDARPA